MYAYDTDNNTHLCISKSMQSLLITTSTSSTAAGQTRKFLISLLCASVVWFPASLWRLLLAWQKTRFCSSDLCKIVTKFWRHYGGSRYTSLLCQCAVSRVPGGNRFSFTLGAFITFSTSIMWDAGMARPCKITSMVLGSIANWSCGI